MSKKNLMNRKSYFGNLPSNFLPNLGKDLLVGKITSKDISEDSFGNCSISGKPIEANACSLIKDNYKKP